VEIVKDQGELLLYSFLMKIVLCMYLTLVRLTVVVMALDGFVRFWEHGVESTCITIKYNPPLVSRNILINTVHRHPDPLLETPCSSPAI